MVKITVRAIEAAKPKDKPYQLIADRGLFLNVPKTGVKTWSVRYSINGKQHYAVLPLAYGTSKGKMSLAEACIENSRIQALARQGINFKEADENKLLILAAEEKKQKIASLTFGDLFNAWLCDGVSRVDNNAELIRSFGKDVLPLIGDILVRDVSEGDLRHVLKTMISERDVKRMAVRTYNDFVQLFKWAEKRQPWRSLMNEGNPADLLEITTLVGKDYDMNNIRDRVLSDQEIRELFNLFITMEADYNNTPKGMKYSAIRPLNKESQLALWLCLSTLCRIGELTMSEWRHVNFEERTWFIPKENIKTTNGKKQDHLVFLSNFAIKQFKMLYEFSGNTAWCFPNRNKTTHLCTKTISKQVGDRQICFKDRKERGLAKRCHDNTLVLAKGVNGKWTPHDLRRTGATIMQSLRIPLDIIDRCQNHILEGSKVRRHYLHHEYAEEKKEAWHKLGEYIENTLN